LFLKHHCFPVQSIGVSTFKFLMMRSEVYFGEPIDVHEWFTAGGILLGTAIYTMRR
jgi:hypothetical protein